MLDIKKSVLSDNSGISPVIGVILMVAITVALVSLVTLVVFNLGEDVSAPSDATVELEESNGKVKATVLRNENSQSFKVLYEGNSIDTIDPTSGSSVTIGAGSGSYSIVAVGSDGSETVIQSKNFDNIRDTRVDVTGTVEINPKINGAEVEAYDGNNIVYSTTTNSTGQYELRLPDGFSGKIVVNVEGFNSAATSNQLYAGASKSYSGSDTVNFNFDSSDTITGTVDGNTIDVIYGLGSSNTITNIEMIQVLNESSGTLSNNYQIQRNIDASNTQNWNSKDGFDPIGESFNRPFNGTLSANNHSIKNLYINRLSESEVGLFGYMDENSASVKNLEIKDANITGGNDVGILAGRVSSGPKFVNIKTSGQVYGGAGGGNIGGILGRSYGSINSSSSDATVSGAKVQSGDYPISYGGIVGWNAGTIDTAVFSGTVNGTSEISSEVARSIGGISGSDSAGTIKNATFTGKVVGEYRIGGIIGFNEYGDVINSTSNGDVIGEYAVGGIAGRNSNLINKSYSSSTIEGGEGQNPDSLLDDAGVGGIAGFNIDKIKNSYSVSSVTATENVSAVVGVNSYGTVTNTYGAGSVSGDSNTGGIVAKVIESSTVSNSYWDTQSTGVTTSADGSGVGLNTDDMQGDTYDSGFKNNIVDNPSFTGVSNEYPIIVSISEQDQIDNR